MFAGAALRLVLPEFSNPPSAADAAVTARNRRRLSGGCGFMGLSRRGGWRSGGPLERRDAFRASLERLYPSQHEPEEADDHTAALVCSGTGSLHLRSYRTCIRYSLPAFTGAFTVPFVSLKLASPKDMPGWTLGPTGHILTAPFPLLPCRSKGNVQSCVGICRFL